MSRTRKNHINLGWIEKFVDSDKRQDSWHIDEILPFTPDKSQWIESAWMCYYLVKNLSKQYKNISVALCFELNVTTTSRPMPAKLSGRLFCKTQTPPEIYVFKDAPESYLLEYTYHKELAEQYHMKCYYTEHQDEQDGTFWRWIFFTED